MCACVHLHRVIPSKIYIRDTFHNKGHNFKNMKITCNLCPKSNESNEHIFHECRTAKATWSWVYPTIQDILNTNFKIFDLTLNKFPQGISMNKIKMVSTLIQITLHTIWLNRNKFLFDKVSDAPTLEGTLKQISSNFYQSIKKKFNEHMPNQLQKFRQTFCHTPKVCDVINDKELSVKLL